MTPRARQVLTCAGHPVRPAVETAATASKAGSEEAMSNITEERTGQSDIGQVKERVHDATEQAKGQTREQLRSQIDERTTQAGAHVTSAAQAFRQAAEHLR